MTPLQRVIFRFREHFGPLSGLDFKLAQDAEKEYFALKKLAHPEPGEVPACPFCKGATYLTLIDGRTMSCPCISGTGRKETT